MDILVFSDSHSKIDLMVDIVREIEPDLIFHLGDYDEDARTLGKHFPNIPLHMVRGNSDFFSKTPEQLELTIEDKKVILTHGHRYYVKEAYDALCDMGRSRGADLVFFGHTHIPHYARVGKMHVLNPGSAREVCALVQIKDGEIHCEHIPFY